MTARAAASSLEVWAKRVSGVAEISVATVAAAAGWDPAFPSVEALDAKELLILLLYVIVSRRMFVGSALSSRERLFVKAVQMDIEDMHATLELNSDWVRTWEIT